MKKSDIVTASEIADYTFCPEAWRLAQVGHQSANQPARNQGTAHHARKANVERVAGVSIAFGRILIAVALLLLAALALGR